MDEKTELSVIWYLKRTEKLYVGHYEFFVKALKFSGISNFEFRNILSNLTPEEKEELRKKALPNIEE